MPAYRHPYADLRQRIGMRWLPGRGSASLCRRQRIGMRWLPGRGSASLCRPIGIPMPTPTHRDALATVGRPAVGRHPYADLSASLCRRQRIGMRWPPGRGSATSRGSASLCRRQRIGMRWLPGRGSATSRGSASLCRRQRIGMRWPPGRGSATRSWVGIPMPACPCLLFPCLLL